jgi:hypothetical protein
MYKIAGATMMIHSNKKGDKIYTITNKLIIITTGRRRRGGTIIQGKTPIVCIFCKFMTSIEFDLDLHLYEHHRMELVKLLIGKANMDKRISYAIEDGKRVGMNLQILNREARENLGFES